MLLKPHAYNLIHNCHMIVWDHHCTIGTNDKEAQCWAPLIIKIIPNEECETHTNKKTNQTSDSDEHSAL